MRGLGLFFGAATRNDPLRLRDRRPVTRYEHQLDSGDAGLDGYSVLTRANPRYAGQMPMTGEQEGFTHRGPDNSFEQ